MPNEQDKNKILPFTVMYNRPLAIQSERLSDFAVDKAFIENKISASFIDDFMSDISNHEVIGNTAIIPVHGVIEQRLSLWSLFFGCGASTDLIAKSVKDILSDEKIDQIILDIDSPGGTIDGVLALSELIYNSRSKKKIVAYINTLAASAGYWIASAASEVILSSGSDRIGSIGVVVAHHDVSKMHEAVGVKVTEIYAGKYKRIDSSYAPLSSEGKKFLQDQVDYLYSVFVNNVAKNRGVSPDQVISGMAEGKIFIGEQAIEAGLADGIASIESILSSVNNKGNLFMAVNQTKPKAEEPGQAPAQPPAQEPNETEKLRKENEQLKQENESLKKQLEEKDKQAQSSKEAGAKEERERMLAIDDMAIPGFEAIVIDAKKTGKPVNDTAVALLKAQKDRGISLQGIKSDSQTVVSASSPSGIDEKAELEKMADNIAAGSGRKIK